MSERLTRLKRQKKQKLLVRRLLGLAALLLVVFALVITCRVVADRVSGLRVEVEETRKGVFEEIVTGSALVVQEETVIYAPEEGHFENLVRERERVRRGEVIGKFFTQDGGFSRKVTAPAAGVVIYHTDGLETLMTPATVENLRPQVFSYSIRLVRGLGAPVGRGEAFAKIVNNLKPNALVVRLTDKTDILTKGQQVEVRSRGKDLGKAQVVAVQQVEDYALVGLVMGQFAIDLADVRVLPIELVVWRQEGIIIPRKALITKNGNTGVYCLRKEAVVFRQIEVAAKKADQAMVRGLEPGEYVITTPELVREGMVIPR